MNATPSTPQPNSIGDAATVPAVAAAEIDASCRAPLLLLFGSSAAWLVVSSLLGMIATLKFHQPNLLADCAWLTYGRVHPGASNALVYGFAMQAGLGVLLWVLCDLGRTRLAAPALVIGGALIWNLGLATGILGILYGESTGFEWLEFPRYASVPVILGYLMIGLAGMLSFHNRSERKLHIVQWFLIAALFWFPWIYSTAELTLVIRPVRGALQSVIALWYAHNLTSIWFGFVGVGAAFYFIPRLVNRPLYSHHLGIFTFWTLAIFGSWGGVPTAAPVPSWMPALSTFGAVMTIVPMLAVALNIKNTACVESAGTGDRDGAMRFFTFGMLAYVVAGLVRAIVSLDRVNEVTNFTWFVPAQTQLLLYGFFTMVMFGAIRHIVPRLMPNAPAKAGGWQFGLAASGIVIYALPLAIGGIKQGLAMNDKTVAFLDVVKGTLMFLRISTSGDLLMAAANLIFLLGFLGIAAGLGRACYAAIKSGTRPVEVAA